MGPNGQPIPADDEPAIDVVLSIRLRGPLATIDAAGELTANLDELFRRSYADQYRGVTVKLDVYPANPTDPGKGMIP
jgi:hypothetical protein